METAISPSVLNALYFVGWLAFFYCYHGLGITLGYHRMLTHKALQVPRWLMYLVASGGYLCLMNGPIIWVGVHRLHHQKSDMEGDPHSPQDGFMHALLFWSKPMDGIQSTEELQNQCRDLMKDPLFRLLGTEHKPWTALMCLGICIAFRVVLFCLFGWPCLLGNLISTWVVFWSPQLVNTVCHLPKHGYRTFDTPEQSRNVWWVGLVALGEGWHNNHHAFPTSARHGMQWWEFDLTWAFTVLFEKLGLAKNVVSPTAAQMEAKQQEREPVSV